MTHHRIDAFAFIREWLAAWNAHDLDRILSHYAEDVEFHSPMVVLAMGRSEGAIHGRKDLRDYFARGLAVYPDLHFELIDLFGGVNCLAIRYRAIEGRIALEFFEFGADGKVVRAQVAYAVEGAIHS